MTIEVRKLSHVNQLLGEFEAANSFYAEVFGAVEYMNSYDKAEGRVASLFVIGDTCVELFSPRLENSSLAQQHRRYGDGWHSFEWQVGDLAAAHRELTDRGVRMATWYPGRFLMTDPRDTFGVVIELCEKDMPNDPRDHEGWSASPWRDDHPLGIDRLDRLSIAVQDASAATSFFRDVFSAELVDERPRPAVGARSFRLAVGSHHIELLEPVDDSGPIARRISTPGARLHALHFAVVHPQRCRDYLEACGLRIVAADVPDGYAIDPRDNFGVSWQFEPLR